MQNSGAFTLLFLPVMAGLILFVGQLCGKCLGIGNDKERVSSKESLALSQSSTARGIAQEFSLQSGSAPWQLLNNRLNVPARVALISSLALVLVSTAFAAGSSAGLPAWADLKTTSDKGSEFQLEVWQMPLAQVLKAVEARTGTPIHYSVLPEGFITATCVGSSLKPVLECLLNRKADIIVRYEPGNDSKANNGKIAEAWVLGAKLEAVPNNALCQTQSGQGSIKLNRPAEQAAADSPRKQDQSDLLLKVSQSGKAEDRAQAIGDLLAIGRQNDPNIKAMLEQAAHDPEPAVRAQAISTLTHRDDYGENAPEIIRDALQDDSVDVRLMAVDGITEDADLLQQAVNDRDETVSSLAKLKLQELQQKQRKAQ